ncbi:replication-relaxation family protein [Terribacillus sp. AE2B 122]|uniref:replication-relaxation family protein n=1 Tax=Terribacillus sp. AE2B 122 TaxID=1331902 RepID=UPI00158390B8|nr:replication-relaxation family protein [Terribacillus sp. AE2B 122]
MLQAEKRRLREEKILSTLDSLGFATRKQLQLIEQLGGDRNAHRILKEMEQDKLIGSQRTEQKVYYVAARGRDAIGSTKDELRTGKMKHTLMRNEMYIKLGMPGDWRNEVPVTWGQNKLIPDAMYHLKGEVHFVEVDNTQPMRSNYEKIKRYSELSRLIFESQKHLPTLIWCTISASRKAKLEESCKKAAVKCKVIMV